MLWRGSDLRGALTITLPYLVFSAAWIVYSDRWVTRLPTHVGLSPSELQTIKGLAFVGFSSLLIFGLVIQRLAALRREREISDDLRRSYESLSRRFLQAHEEERKQIAHDLHDELGQNLSLLLRELHEAGDGGDSDIEALSLRAESLLNQVRLISLSLRPAILDDLGLEAALRWLTRRRWGDRDEEIRFRAEVDPAEVPEGLALPVFRIAQEALRNAVRHGRGEQVEILLTEDDGMLELRVRDDGQGFDAEVAMRRGAEGASLGLLTLRERAEAAGGRLEIESAPGEGTEVRASFPAHP